jgi:hypothetical protein
VLVYVRKQQEDAVTKMMKERHPEAELVAIDSHFINPFSKVSRLNDGAGAAGTLKKA